MTSLLTQSRQAFHEALVSSETLSVTDGVASNADGSQQTSRVIARHIATALGARTTAAKHSGQTAGRAFEAAVQSFLACTFPRLSAIRPGTWEILNVGGNRGEYQLAKFEPFRHLDALAQAIERDETLVSVLGNSYSISPDVFITRRPEPDEAINSDTLQLVDGGSGLQSVIRSANSTRAIVHAVVSCKWTLRSDRAQNARSEALNIIRNRKGRTPHIVVVTGEPTPSRLASLALGTGDIDMVYHFALPELRAAVGASGNDEAQAMLSTLIDGQRLRDISDLPLDLCV